MCVCGVKRVVLPYTGAGSGPNKSKNKSPIRARAQDLQAHTQQNTSTWFYCCRCKSQYRTSGLTCGYCSNKTKSADVSRTGLRAYMKVDTRPAHANWGEEKTWDSIAQTNPSYPAATALGQWPSANRGAPSRCMPSLIPVMRKFCRGDIMCVCVCVCVLGS